MFESLKKRYYRFLKSRHPFGYSQITDQLFIGTWPVAENYAEIVNLGVRLVINMDWVPPDPKLNEAPLRLLTLETTDTPLTPMPLDKIWIGVQAAGEAIAKGEKVMVYCKAGVHRSATMACCILISQGNTTEQAIQTVKAKRPKAKPEDAHYKKVIQEFERAWIAANPDSPQSN